jgi:hypothetical protein
MRLRAAENLRRSFAAEELLGDRAVGTSRGDELGDLTLASGQLVAGPAFEAS